MKQSFTATFRRKTMNENTDDVESEKQNLGKSFLVSQKINAIKMVSSLMTSAKGKVSDMNALKPKKTVNFGNMGLDDSNQSN